MRFSSLTVGLLAAVSATALTIPAIKGTSLSPHS